ncbi:TIGR03364 family FAD-dependent oxidoreductase [Ostreibacterium oceani]|uniref:TIGR03364 family FAD-dependent oxidoreductase n=1 Tax=Ostreibacterium oceani TaxID=2654998 RepID=A0A6N7ETX4_9GAMM|nr:TIGR03364 family FAD-dependent oxidoreductase [Ostreibacterium oceani]MPV86001.1 TIGR03364 family FAD-dependent oxidoreductase [Ostreibacterium oceani]
MRNYDIVVIGSGIIGLATAYAAVKQGLSVAVLERHARCVGASIRNFGFITVSGQRAGEHWRRAKYSRDRWAEIAPQAGIPIAQRGLYMPAQRPEATAVAEAFLHTEMGKDCRWLSKTEIAEKLPFLGPHEGVLFSPHELRVESKTAIPQLANWLTKVHHVDFYWQTQAHRIELPTITTSQGEIRGEHCIVCAHHDATHLYPELYKQAAIKLCTLQMLRVKPQKSIPLPGALMSDLSFARYDGFAQLPEGKFLGLLLDQTMENYRQFGIHLIVVQSQDGSWIIGDSHRYTDAEIPFRDEHIDALIIAELQRLIPNQTFSVRERWLGVYPSADDVVLKYSPTNGVAVGVVTSGTGASTGFALGEELLTLALNSNRKTI